LRRCGALVAELTELLAEPLEPAEHAIVRRLVAALREAVAGLSVVVLDALPPAPGDGAVDG
jgi:hypothetical protein